VDRVACNGDEVARRVDAEPLDRYGIAIGSSKPDLLLRLAGLADQPRARRAEEEAVLSLREHDTAVRTPRQTAGSGLDRPES